MTLLKYLPYAGWPLAGLIFWFWLGVKEDLAAEIERCNTDKLKSALEAERATREIQLAAERERAQQIASSLAAAERALAQQRRSTSEAEERAENAIAAIQKEANREPQDCGNARPDRDFWNDLRLHNNQIR